jgi:hypothetical protein
LISLARDQSSGEYRTYRLDFGDVKLRVIRNSGWCKRLKKDSIIIGDRLYVAGEWVTQKILKNALKEKREKREGKFGIFWKLMDKVFV